MTERQRDEILRLLGDYNKNLKPMILALESEDSEYPVEVLNEIRAILNHLSRIAVIESGEATDIEDVTQAIDLQIHDATGHLKRGLFDCFKYCCISLEDKYKQFKKDSRNLDLGVIDNGEFSIELSKRYTEAKDSLFNARLIENDPSNRDADKAFEAFGLAYVKYRELDEYIKESTSKIERARHIQTPQQIISYGIGLLGVVLTIISLFT